MSLYRRFIPEHLFVSLILKLRLRILKAKLQSFFLTTLTLQKVKVTKQTPSVVELPEFISPQDFCVAPNID